jgi:hypothetical protein
VNPAFPKITGTATPKQVRRSLASMVMYILLGASLAGAVAWLAFMRGAHWQYERDQTALDAAYADRDAAVIRASDLVQSAFDAQQRTAAAMEDTAQSLRMMRPQQKRTVQK